MCVIGFKLIMHILNYMVTFQIRNIRLHQFGLTRSTNPRDDLDVRKNAEISKRLLLTTVKHALSVSLYEDNLLVEKQMDENAKDDGRKS